MTNVSDIDIDDVAEFHRWLAEVADETRERFGPEDRLGTANYIDPAAVLRAANCVELGESISLARPLVEGPGFQIETSSDQSGTVLLDRVDVSCHGHAKTHMDALNHLATGGVFYGGRSQGDAALPTIEDLAGHCLFTRALFADITAVRGTPWVPADEPVTGADIDAALEGVEVMRGDALILYMGRDRWEASGMVSDGPTPGAGRSAARWLVANQTSVLAWDFLDAHPHPEDAADAKGTVHRLLPAAGLILIDNADLGAAAAVMRRTGRRTAALAALPLAVPGGTGSLVTPWLIL